MKTKRKEMRKIKFRYRLQQLSSKKGHEEWFEYKTIEEIEGFHTTATILSRDQYIGLKDKNGKEIYYSDYLSYQIAYNRREIVIVIEGKFGFEFHLLNDGFYGHMNKKIIRKEWKYINKCEIIGNIHKNRELYIPITIGKTNND